MRHRWMSVPMISLLLLLSACGGQQGGDRAEQRALEIRAEYVAMQACGGSMEVTADYGQRVYEYGIDFTWEKEGETVLTITAPENIAGLTARLEKGETALEYDGARIETGPLAPDGMSPVDAIPALLTYAREGFLAECVLEESDGVEILHAVCREPEATPGSGREAGLWFDADTHTLLRGEISQDGYTVVQCVFTSFTAS